jgi:hypothetical protein
VPCTVTATVNLIEPNTTFEDRLTQLDIRLSKVFDIRRVRLQAMFDICNLFNENTVLGINNRYGPSWLLPSNILGARLFKLGVQVDF